jgi:hypothetical protein
MRNARPELLALSQGVPPSGEPSVLERPPPGLARGSHAVPAPVVIGVAALLVLATLAYYFLRWRRSRGR